jgi:hypothetical protein
VLCCTVVRGCRIHEEVFTVESTSHVVEAATAVSVVNTKHVTSAPQCSVQSVPEGMDGESHMGRYKPPGVRGFKLQLGRLLCFQ